MKRGNNCLGLIQLLVGIEMMKMICFLAFQIPLIDLSKCEIISVI